MSKNNTNAVAVAQIPEETIALSLTQQYNDINTSTAELVRKVVHFGCAMAQAEIELDGRGLLKNRKQGQGMQTWLKSHCPDINYKTAMRWKQIAVRAANSLGCSSSEALSILTGEATDVTKALAKRRDEIYSQDSLRKLSQMLFNFAADETGTAGRPAGGETTGAKLTKVESARRLWAQPISLFSRNRQAFYSAVTLLPIDEARDSLAELKQLVSCLEKRIKEGK